MEKKSIFQNKEVMNAIYIGSLCSVSYLAVYVARNVLGAVSPGMLDNGFGEVFIGKASSIYFIFYAIGQLINGAIGDKVKAKYMISIGLFMAGVTNFLFSVFSATYPYISITIYGFTGFFLSMIYGPMTKVVAENTLPIYATRCSLGYTVSSFLGSPFAGILAALLMWRLVFSVSSIILIVMAVVCFVVFGIFEKKGIVEFNKYAKPKVKGGSIKLLIERSIIKFTVISFITGIVRTTVVFWLPTYISQYLGFSSEDSAFIFTVATFIISFTAFIAVFVYEKLKRNMDLTILIMFVSSTALFALLYFVKTPWLNISIIVGAIMASNAAATMLWSRYCPSLRDTGMVSGATGFLDFVSYMAASLSSAIFANAVSSIGWGNLILVWFGLAMVGVLISLPYKKKKVETTKLQ